MSFLVSGEGKLNWTAKEAVKEAIMAGGARRGFCTKCGSKLYYRNDYDFFSVDSGIVKGSTGGRTTKHIFVGSKLDFYQINDGLPQFKDIDRSMSRGR